MLGRTYSQHFRNTEHASHSTARMAEEHSNPFIWEHSKAIKHYAHTILFLTLLSFPLALSHFYAHSTHFNSIWHLRKQMFSAELPLLGRSSTSQVMSASTPARPPHLGDLNLTVSACPTPSSPLFSSVPPPQAQSPINTSLLPIKDSSKPKFHLVKNNTKLVPALNHLQLRIPRLNWFHLSPSKVITSLKDEESTFYPHLNLF